MVNCVGIDAEKPLIGIISAKNDVSTAHKDLDAICSRVKRRNTRQRSFYKIGLRFVHRLYRSARNTIVEVRLAVSRLDSQRRRVDMLKRIFRRIGICCERTQHCCGNAARSYPNEYSLCVCMRRHYDAHSISKQRTRIYTFLRTNRTYKDGQNPLRSDE